MGSVVGGAFSFSLCTRSLMCFLSVALWEFGPCCFGCFTSIFGLSYASTCDVPPRVFVSFYICAGFVSFTLWWMSSSPFAEGGQGLSSIWRCIALGVCVGLYFRLFHDQESLLLREPPWLIVLAICLYILICGGAVFKCCAPLYIVFTIPDFFPFCYRIS